MTIKNRVFWAVVFCALIATVATTFCLIPRATAKQLAGIPWSEFKKRSELVFSGCLEKGELIRRDANSPARDVFRQTYRVSKVFKGEEIKEITFDTRWDADVNKRIGGIAILALRKNKTGGWELSVDERCCWPHKNEMTTGYHGYPVYEICDSYLYDMPAEMTETADIMVQYGGDYRLEKVKVHPMYKIDGILKKLLQD